MTTARGKSYNNKYRYYYIIGCQWMSLAATMETSTSGIACYTQQFQSGVFTDQRITNYSVW